MSEKDDPMASVRAIAPHLRVLNAPEPIRAVPGWIMWRRESYKDEPKPRKVPYYVSGVKRYGQQGSPTDRANLVTFAAARDAAVRMGFDGVGLALLPDWQLTALDVDNCVDADGNIPDEIHEIVTRTYAEYSPSGKGIRAFFFGNLGNHRSHTSAGPYGLETFSSNGFVTFTGNILPHVDILGYEDRVAHVPEELVALCQSRFGTSSGAAFDPDDFMAGREPRLGLTVEQMEELLSALDPNMPREPWLRVGLALHHECEGDDTGFDFWDEWSSEGATYPGTEALRYQWDSFKGPTPGRRQVTAATLIKMAKEAEIRPLNAEVLMASISDRQAENGEGRTPDNFDGKFPIHCANDAILRRPIEWLVKGVLPRGELGILFGASGSGKTFVALDLAIALSLGVAWRGHRVPEAVRVLYIAAEGSGGVGNRIKAYLKKHEIESPRNLSVMMVAPSLMEQADVGEVLSSIIAAGGFDVIIIDTFAQVTPGANENAADDMGRALANLRALATAAQAMPIVVHHAGKDPTKGSRGWSGLKAAADVQIEIIRRENGAREIHIEKLKDGEDGARFGFELEVVDLGVDGDGDPVSSCVVHHTKTATIQRGRNQPKPTGANQQKVLDCARDGGAATPLGASIAEVIEQAIRSIPYDPATSEGGKPKRDQRRSYVTRALQSLCDRGFLVARDERIFVPSNCLEIEEKQTQPISQNGRCNDENGS